MTGSFTLPTRPAVSLRLGEPLAAAHACNHCLAA